MKTMAISAKFRAKIKEGKPVDLQYTNVGERFRREQARLAALKAKQDADAVEAKSKTVQLRKAK